MDQDAKDYIVSTTTLQTVVKSSTVQGEAQDQRTLHRNALSCARETTD